MHDSKYFVVLEGRQCGIFTKWRDCETQVSGHSNPIFRNFKTREEAEICISKYNERKKKRQRPEIDDDELVAASFLISMRDYLGVSSRSEKCRVKKAKKFTEVFVVGTVHKIKEVQLPIPTIGIHFYECDRYANVSSPIVGINNEVALTLFAIMRVLMTVNSMEDILIFTESRHCIEAVKSTQSSKGQHGVLINEIRSLIIRRLGKTTFEWTTSDLNKKANELSRNCALSILSPPK